MILAAFDVGTSKMGSSLWSLDKGRPKKFLASAQHELEGHALAMRLSSLGKLVFDYVRAKKPRIVAIETGFIAFKHRDKSGDTWSNPMSNLALAEARGVIRERSIAAGALEILDVSPKAAKLASTGDPFADKGKVRVHVQMIAGLQYLPEEDEGDAIAIGLAGIHAIESDPEVYFL